MTYTMKVSDVKATVRVSESTSNGDWAIAMADMVLPYVLKDGVPSYSYTLSREQEELLTFLKSGAVFTAQDVQGKLLALDAEKYRKEQKIYDAKWVLRTSKMLMLFGISGVSARISKKGNTSFKFDGKSPENLPFKVTFKSPEEIEAARLAALDKRVTKAMESKAEQKVVLSAIAKVQPTKEAEIPANVKEEAVA